MVLKGSSGELKHFVAGGAPTLGDPLPPPIPPPPPSPPPCNCPEFCEGKASGTMAYCEEGIWREIAPPTANSVLQFNVSTGIPYWNPL